MATTFDAGAWPDVTPAEGVQRRRTVREVLTAAFDVVALNLVLVVVSMLVVTIPAAIAAAFAAVYRWRHHDEGRVVTTFLEALRSRPWERTTVFAPAVAAAVIGVVEVTYFVHLGGLIALVCVAMGLLTSALGVASTALLGLFAAMHPHAGFRELWTMVLAVGGRTARTLVPLVSVVTLPMVLLGLVDPALVVVVIPVLLVWALLTIAVRAARRVGLEVPLPDAPVY